MFGRRRPPGEDSVVGSQWGDDIAVGASDGSPAHQECGDRDIVEVLLARFEDLEQGQRHHIDSLTDQLAAKDRTLVAMNEAVEASRRDQVAVFLTPAARKLADLEHEVHDASSKSRQSLASDREQFVAEFDHVAESLVQIMETLGFDRVPCEVGMPFDAKLHKAVKTSRTSRHELDRTIATVLRPGYTFIGGSRTTLPATVIVNEYVNTAEEA